MEPTIATRPSFDETIPGPNNSLSISEIRSAFEGIEADVSRRSIPGALRILYEQVKARESLMAVRSMTSVCWIMFVGAVSGYVFSPPMVRDKIGPWTAVLGLLAVAGILFSFRYRHGITRARAEIELIRQLCAATLTRLADDPKSGSPTLDKDQLNELRTLLKATKQGNPALLRFLE